MENAGGLITLTEKMFLVHRMVYRVKTFCNAELKKKSFLGREIVQRCSAKIFQFHSIFEHTETNIVKRNGGSRY